MKFDTIDDIVDDLMFKVEDSDKKLLLNPPTDPAQDEYLAYAWGKDGFLRWIRNHYNLWKSHPLTNRWLTHGGNDIREGVDYSADHPDNVSGQIFDRFVERLKASQPKD